jgi:hypothetical protein
MNVLERGLRGAQKSEEVITSATPRLLLGLGEGLEARTFDEFGHKLGLAELQCRVSRESSSLVQSVFR